MVGMASTMVTAARNFIVAFRPLSMTLENSSRVLVMSWR